MSGNEQDDGTQYIDNGGLPNSSQIVGVQPDLKVLKHISEKSSERVKALEKSYPALINNPDQTFGNIPNGVDFKLVMLKQKRLAIFGRARMGKSTLKSISSQYEAEYISRLETLRGKDAMERIMLTTNRMVNVGGGESESGKQGIFASVRKRVGI